MLFPLAAFLTTMPPAINCIRGEFLLIRAYAVQGVVVGTACSNARNWLLSLPNPGSLSVIPPSAFTVAVVLPPKFCWVNEDSTGAVQAHSVAGPPPPPPPAAQDGLAPAPPDVSTCPA